MRFLEYLFFKYYYFQVAVGNEDIAPFSSICFICFILLLWCASLIAFCYFFIPYFTGYPLPSVYVFLDFYVVIFIILCYIFLYHKKFKRILTTHENEWKGKKNTGAVLFAVVPFVVLIAELFIKMWINRGFK